MGNLFNMDNKFFVFMGKVADLIILNLIFIVCCIPIVTIGASLTALHYVTMKMARNEESYIIKSFFKSFKENFKQATIIHLIMLIAGILLFLDISIVSKMSGTAYTVLYCIFIALCFVLTLIFIYIYPVLAKFYNTVKRTFMNAFLMATKHLPTTILMLVISLSPVAILFIPSFQVQSFVIMMLLLMGFSTIAFTNAHFFVKIFDKYIPTEEETDTDDGTLSEILTDEVLPEKTDVQS